MTPNNEIRDEERADEATPVDGGMITMNRKKFYSIIAIFATVTLVSVVLAVTLPLTMGKKAKPVIKADIANEIPLNQQRTPEMLELNERIFQQNKLNVFLPEFNNQILEGYRHCEDLQHDIEQALGYYANFRIKEHMNTYVDFVEFYDDYFPDFDDNGGTMTVSMPVTFDTAETSAPQASYRSEKITESSFGTNNQQEDVDESDIIKSDGTYVYAVYGKDVVVLDTLGKELFRLELVEMERNDDWFFDDNVQAPMGPETLDSVHQSDPSTMDMSKTEGEWVNQTTETTQNLNNRRTTIWMPTSKEITGLSLHGSRLVAIISDENFYYVTTSAFVTEVVIIDIDLTNGSLSIVDRKSIPGSHVASRLIDSNMHLVTKSFLYHYKFEEKINRYTSEFHGLNDTEYALIAFEVASDAISHHARMLMQELISSENPDSETFFEDPFSDLTLSSEICRHIAKLSSYQDTIIDEGTFMGLNLLHQFTKITSFDVLSPIDESLSVSASFLPSSFNVDFYASKDMMFLGGRGWSKTLNKKNVADSSSSVISNEATFITAFQLSGASAIPKATGMIPGYSLNQFSYDYYDNHLRVATTISGRSKWNPITQEVEALSESSNQIIVAVVDGNEIRIVGMLENLGKNEIIYAVRFVGHLGFMVTFRRTDPFYTIDLSNPTAPSLIGELKIPGFSNYLHPIDDDYIIAVGQDADENGETLGLQVAIFDVTDLKNPQQIAKHVVKGWSSSASQSDHYAFRYLPMNQKLILPISNYEAKESSFDGFYIFDINPDFDKNLNEEGISLDFIVSHYDAEQSQSECYTSSYLQPRSLVFEGDVMTFKGHNILSHDLATGTKQFELALDEELDSNDCFGWFW